MNHHDGNFDAENGARIYFRRWTPAGAPRAVLMLLHGLAEHSGRYDEFAAFFTSSGFAVHALDHPGHGRSAGKKGHIGKFDEFAAVLEGFLKTIREANPEVPLILVGHSMGGLMAASFLIEHQAEFAAAVLSGPAIRAPQPPSRFALFVVRVIARLFPRLGVMQLNAGGVSRDPEVVRKYENDPLVFRGKVTACMAAELFGAMARVIKRAGEISLPMLILHGAEDSLTDVNGSRALYARISSAEKKIIVYDGLYHEIFNEPERFRVMSDMKDWLEERLSAQDEHSSPQGSERQRA